MKSLGRGTTRDPESGDTQLLELRAGNSIIPYTLTRRSGHRLTINVHPDAQVTVRAPVSRSLDEVAARVQARAGWILRQLTHFEQFKPPPAPRRYVAGETYLYLGRQYRLKTVHCNQPDVKLIGRYLWVWTTVPGDAVRVKELVDRWYRSHAELAFARCLDRCLIAAKSLGVEISHIETRFMRRRWGSCSKSGRILLNVELVKAPVHCIEYVIMHELCHLRVHDHSERFYRLLGRHMPDWQRRKDRLDSLHL